ncbi:MAG: hypothetical protein AUI17_08200 [Acidobacteriales bacterium 13_2_20CM_2_55_5]|nr:MAG: hypothetical protein AUI17_08200 [Acidobacteriales bacterium 13_2_20CM_2_55_5]OLD17692.1 MAG: hypothetical protein AUI85_06390 [Acidobacteriales bacterium 13_1_40CM_3_55_5]
MAPATANASQMVKVTGFIQRNPHNGDLASQRTEAYLGYDEKNLYVVFVCFDDPAKVRARMSRREDIFDDDTVEIMLDTFHDRRRAYAFQTTPLGVQWDAIWTEVPHEDNTGSTANFDPSFDTVWHSNGKLTSRGYVVWMAIPFKSLRFSPAREQSWGIILYRGILRENEDDFWPEISRSVEGRLAQGATAGGLEDISPGRNMQFIPYGVLRSFRALDTRDPTAPRFDHRDAEFRGGIDSKFVLHDNLVLDVTANPDFSQVESDEPQITVNQRFEVFFPERRPFFLENSDYFKTPIDLFFTRRIGDPQFGARLTGKVGPYSLGILATDDRGPGNRVPDSDPLAGERSTFAIARVNRDIFGQSSIGAIYTDWEFPAADEFNRVGGIDSRLKFNPNWTGNFEAVTSSTKNQDGSYEAGPAYKAEANYSATHLNYDATYNDISPGFTTNAGFVNRVDIRQIGNSLDYRFWPESSSVLSWGPSLLTDHVWSHDGTRLDALYSPTLVFRLRGQTFFNFSPYTDFRERLRPRDFPTLAQDQDYHEHNYFIAAGTSYLPKATVQAYYQRGTGVDFVPPADQSPVLALADVVNLLLSFRPISALKIDNTYLFDRLRDRNSGAAIFNNHIVRSKWNWQFNRQLSLRLILQYTATLANPALTSLETSKQFNGDFLITYLLHPGTAIYVGYNSDLQNLMLDSAAGTITRTRTGYINDSRQFFVKVSYLFRF